jgi:predicted lactoylglutathione lyase
MPTKNTPSRKLFVNLPVRDLERSKTFFMALGFEFNPQFTSDQGACMVISEEAFVMLLVEPHFRTFTKKAICDAAQYSEAINALSCANRQEVDAIYAKAIAGGGKPAMPPQDHGFMYSTSFYDLDDHHWEVLWMDPAAIQG